MSKLKTTLRALVAAVLVTPLLALAAAPDTFMNGQSIYGQPGAGGSNARVVDVASAKYVNVEYGDTVTFTNAGKTFVWTFNGLSRRAVDVSKIAPDGFSDRGLVVYVGRNTLTNRN